MTEQATTGPTRAEHMEWCKQRALEYVERGDLNQAFQSMMSDLGKHPETAGHPAADLGGALFFSGHLSNEQKMREFINGFN